MYFKTFRIVIAVVCPTLLKRNGIMFLYSMLVQDRKILLGFYWDLQIAIGPNKITEKEIIMSLLFLS